ncbi:MAG: bis-aminopropyl spermidine synthase family protein [Candidatus Aenigmatarchaeota archaeon]
MDRIEAQIIQNILLGETDYFSILSKQDASIKEFIEKMEEMKTKGIVDINRNTVSLTKKGREIAKNFLKTSVDCKNCVSGIAIRGVYKKIFQKFKKIVKGRPNGKEEYDQDPMRVEDVIRRVEFISQRGDIHGNIFIIGDDDLLSIALSLTGLPQKIVVVDVDKRIIDFINQVSKKLSLNLEAFVYDVQKELPKEFKRKFDVFITDPVEALEGLKLFLSRGVSALNGIGASGYFGLTTLEASRKKWYEVEKMLLEMGFVITDIKRRFSIYPSDEMYPIEITPLFKHIQFESGKDWYCSSFLRIEAVKEPKPIVEGEVVMDEKLYVDEETLATPISIHQKF